MYQFVIIVTCLHADEDLTDPNITCSSWICKFRTATRKSLMKVSLKDHLYSANPYSRVPPPHHFVNVSTYIHKLCRGIQQSENCIATFFVCFSTCETFLPAAETDPSNWCKMSDVLLNKNMQTFAYCAWQRGPISQLEMYEPCCSVEQMEAIPVTTAGSCHSLSRSQKPRDLER